MPDGQVVDLPSDGTVVTLPSVADRARANQNPNSPGNQLSDRVISEAGTDEQRMRNKGAAFAAPAVAALPFVLIPAGMAGLAAYGVGAGATTGLAAYGVGAAAGLTGGLMANETNKLFGSTEAKQGAALLNSLGIDTIIGGAAHGIGEATNAVTTGLLPRVVESQANKSANGAKILDKLWFDTRNKLFTMIRDADVGTKPPIVGSVGQALVKSPRPNLSQMLLSGEVEPAAAQAAQQVGGGVMVPIGEELNRAFTALKGLPKGADAFGEELTKGTVRGNRILKSIENTLVVNQGGTAMQPLGGLIRIRATLNTIARNASQKVGTGAGELSGEEAAVFGRLSDDLDNVIVRELKSISPEAVGLYNRSNELGQLKAGRSAVVKIAEKTMGQIFNAHKMGTGLGGAIGGALGFKAGGYAGAVAGASIGVSASAYAAEKIPAAATWALKQAITNPKSAEAAKAAIRFATLGQNGPALATMTRAFALAGIRNYVKDYLDGDNQIQPEPSPDDMPQQVAP